MLAGKRKTETTTEVSYRTGDERLVKLTAAAAAKVSGLLQRQGRPQGVLRVAVTGGGCSGAGGCWRPRAGTTRVAARSSARWN